MCKTDMERLSELSRWMYRHIWMEQDASSGLGGQEGDARPWSGKCKQDLSETRRSPAHYRSHYGAPFKAWLISFRRLKRPARWEDRNAI